MRYVGDGYWIKDDLYNKMLLVLEENFQKKDKKGKDDDPEGDYCVPFTAIHRNYPPDVYNACQAFMDAEMTSYERFNYWKSAETPMAKRSAMACFGKFNKYIEEISRTYLVSNPKTITTTVYCRCIVSHRGPPGAKAQEGCSGLQQRPAPRLCPTVIHGIRQLPSKNGVHFYIGQSGRNPRSKAS